MGILFSGGRGTTALQTTLETQSSNAQPVDVSFQKSPIYLHQIPQEALVDKTLTRKLRRADRFCKMAIIAASDALTDAHIDPADGKRTGIILATAIGPHRTTFRFLDDIREFGDAKGSPTIFSHSVHNAAASYVAKTLNLQGQSFTLTDFFFSFQQALLLAQCWLDEKQCDRVLIGSVDELGSVMQYICSQKLTIAKDGQIKPLDFSTKAQAVPGEASVFMVLSNEQSSTAYANIDNTLFSPSSRQSSSTTPLLIETDGLLSDESIYRRYSNAPLLAYSNSFGSILSGSSLYCAAAALMLKNQPNTTHLQTLRYSPNKTSASIQLSKLT